MKMSKLSKWIHMRSLSMRRPCCPKILEGLHLSWKEKRYMWIFSNDVDFGDDDDDNDDDMMLIWWWRWWWWWWWWWWWCLGGYPRCTDPGVHYLGCWCSGSSWHVFSDQLDQTIGPWPEITSRRARCGHFKVRHGGWFTAPIEKW